MADAGLIVEEPVPVGPRPTPSSDPEAKHTEPYGVEGLMDAYLFTGNRRFLNAGRSLAARIAKEGSVGGQDVTNVASRSIVLMKGYEATGDRRWLEAAKVMIGNTLCLAGRRYRQTAQAFPSTGRAVAGEFQGGI